MQAPVTGCDSQSTACGIELSPEEFWIGVDCIFTEICILGIAEYFLIALFQISEIKKDEIRFKKYIFFARYVFDCRGEGSSNRNASRDESVEAGDKSVEAGDESIEAGEKHRNHVIIYSKACYVNNTWVIPVAKPTSHPR